MFPFPQRRASKFRKHETVLWCLWNYWHTTKKCQTSGCGRERCAARKHTVLSAFWGNEISEKLSWNTLLRALLSQREILRHCSGRHMKKQLCNLTSRMCAQARLTGARGRPSKLKELAIFKLKDVTNPNGFLVKKTFKIILKRVEPEIKERHLCK